MGLQGPMKPYFSNHMELKKQDGTTISSMLHIIYYYTGGE